MGPHSPPETSQQPGAQRDLGSLPSLAMAELQPGGNKVLLPCYLPPTTVSALTAWGVSGGLTLSSSPNSTETLC